MKLIVGLGNPEDKYAGTRHNLGFEVVDELRRKLNAPEWENRAKFKAEISKVSLQSTDYSLPAGKAGLPIILVRPQTYMNKSGLAISMLASFFKVETENIIIVYDELDLPLGQIKIRLGGAAAGHHGVESVIEALGDKFIRVRLGIGNLKTQAAEHGGHSVGIEKYVLEPFMRNEKSEVKKMLKQAIKALEILLEKGLEKAQSQFN